jgi:predicted metal-dependent phosphoesterase TrpH
LTQSDDKISLSSPSFQYWRMDLHIHTHYSHDGVASPEQMVDAAITRQLDGIAVTDHDTIEGGLAALEYVQSLEEHPILVIPGIEVSSACGHILAIGVKEDIQSRMSGEETINEIHRLGGLAIAAHPFDTIRAGCGDALTLIEKTLDGIEVINGGIILPWANRRARNWAKKHRLSMTGGSDAHIPEIVGCAYTLIQKPSPSTPPNESVILHQIQKGHVKPAGGTSRLSEKIRKEWRRGWPRKDPKVDL